MAIQISPPNLSERGSLRSPNRTTLSNAVCVCYLASCVCYSYLAVALSYNSSSRGCVFVFQRKIHSFTLIHTFYIINQRWMIFTEIDQVILKKKKRNCYFHCTNHKHKFLSKYHSTCTCFPYLHVYNCPYFEVVNHVW